MDRTATITAAVDALAAAAASGSSSRSDGSTRPPPLSTKLRATAVGVLCGRGGGDAGAGDDARWRQVRVLSVVEREGSGQGWAHTP